MTTAYKIKARFVVTNDHSCDCEFCDLDAQIEQDGSWTETLLADDLEDAKRQLKKMIEDEFSYSDGMKDFSFEVLEASDLPDGKYIFNSDREIIMNGRYFSDGFVALESDLACFVGGGQRKEVSATFSSDLSQPLGGFVHDGGGHCVFDDVVFNSDFIKRLHGLGISVWSLTAQVSNEPFGLEKDGRLVGWIMPMHSKHFNSRVTRNELISRSKCQYQPATPTPAEEAQQ